MKFKLCAIALLLTACGPDWNECTTCKPDEPSAESVDGNEQIPVVVNVDVVVTVNNTNVLVTNSFGGTTNTFGSTTVSPGGPALTCRTVCTRYIERLQCDQGWHGTDTKGRCTKKVKKCVEEMFQCF